MAASASHAVTGLLLAWSQGEQAALEKLALWFMRSCDGSLIGT